MGRFAAPFSKGVKMVQRQLRQTTTGRIYNYSKALAARSDMVPHPPIVENHGLAEPGKAGAKLIEIEYNRVKYLIGNDSVPDFNKLVNEVEDLKLENLKLADDLSKRPKPEPPLTRESVEKKDEKPEVSPENAVLGADNRMEAIVEAIGLLVESGDKNHFASNGMPKVQAIQEVTDFDITAKERDEAWEMINKK